MVITVPMKYDKLNTLLKQQGLKRKDLIDVASHGVMAKLSKGEPVNTKILCAICAKLHCDISDIMEYEYDEADCTKQNIGLRVSMKRKDE